MAEAISLCWIIIELICFFLFCECFMERRNWSVLHVLPAITATICIFLYSKYYTDKIPTTFFTPITYFLLSFCFYKGQWQYRVISSLMCILLIVVLDSTVIYSFGALLKINLSELTQQVYAMYSAGFISKFSLLLVAWYLYRFFSKTANSRIQIRWLILTLLFPAMSYAILVFMILNFRNDRTISTKALGLTLVIAIANIGTLYLIYQIEKSEKNAQRVTLLDQQMDIQTQSILGLEKSYRSQRAVSHEFTHHLNTISILLEEQQYETAKQYIHTLQEQQTTRVFVVNSHHPIVDAILNQKYQSAAERGIDIQIQVNDLAKLNISTEKVVVILSNLLDNAIEACERYSGEKAIQFSMILADKLILSIRNTTEPVQVLNGVPRTTKPDKQNHGYGLQNVERLLDDMMAEHAWTYHNYWFSFVAEIPIS